MRQRGHHPVAGLQLTGVFAEFLYNAGDFEAWAEREWRLELVPTRDHQVVSEVDPRGPYREPHLPGRGRRRSDLFEGESVRLAPLLAEHRLHRYLILSVREDLLGRDPSERFLVASLIIGSEHAAKSSITPGISDTRVPFATDLQITFVILLTTPGSEMVRAARRIIVIRLPSLSVGRSESRRWSRPRPWPRTR